MEILIAFAKAEDLGIDFESAEYTYETHAGDDSETPEQAELEVSHG